MTPYRGYTATVRFEPDDRLFHGHVEGIRHVVHFAGETVDGLEAAFRDSVDDYLAWAAEEGFAPQRPDPRNAGSSPDPEETDGLVREAARMDNQSVDAWSRRALARAALERLGRVG